MTGARQPNSPDYTGREWTGKVGASWATEWRRTDRSFGILTDRLLNPMEPGHDTCVVDIGCGAGELLTRLAPAHPNAEFIGVDIAADLLTVARHRCASLPNVRIVEADAARWTPAQGLQPELLLSRHGVMFFAEPIAAFSHLRELAASDARLRFSCFRARADNGWISALSSVFTTPPAPPADPFAPGPFAFGDPDRVADILQNAGWRNPAFEPLDYAMVAGEGDDAVKDALDYFQHIGPAASALSELGATERAAALDRLREILRQHHLEGRVSLPAAAWIVTASAG